MKYHARSLEDIAGHFDTLAQAAEAQAKSRRKAQLVEKTNFGVQAKVWAEAARIVRETELVEEHKDLATYGITAHTEQKRSTY